MDFERKPIKGEVYYQIRNLFEEKKIHLNIDVIFQDACLFLEEIDNSGWWCSLFYKIVLYF